MGKKWVYGSVVGLDAVNSGIPSLMFFLFSLLTTSAPSQLPVIAIGE
jgi:hypothetical protein